MIWQFWCAAILFLITAGLNCYSIIRIIRDVEDLKAKTAALWDRVTGRDGALVDALTGNIDAELEKSAQMTEMRQAKRRTLPREDAGQPAKVHRMKFPRK